MAEKDKLEIATLGGGCFWCLEAGVLAHEMWEGYQMQVKGLGLEEAHLKAIREAEDVVNRSVRLLGRRNEYAILDRDQGKLYRKFTYEWSGKVFDVQLELCVPDIHNVCSFKETEKKK